MRGVRTSGAPGPYPRLWRRLCGGVVVDREVDRCGESPGPASSAEGSTGGQHPHLRRQPWPSEGNNAGAGPLLWA